MKRRFFGFFLSLVIVLGLCSGCGGSVGGDIYPNSVEYGYTDGFAASDALLNSGSASYNKGSYDYEYDVDNSGQEVYGQEYDDYLSNRKIIKTARMSAETKDYDNFMAWIDRQVSAYKGYIESMSEEQRSNYSPRLYYSDYNSYDWYGDGSYDSGYYMTRYAYLTIRVPSKSLETFMSMIGDYCNVTSKSVDSDDVTLSYIDIESRLNALQTEQWRIMELLEQAESLEDIITLESKLSDLNYQIESYTSQLRVMDNCVDYSTVNLNISEVVDFTEVEAIPNNYLGRLWAAFVRGWANVRDDLIAFSFWISESFAALMVWFVIIVGALKLTKNQRAKWSENRKAEKARAAEMRSRYRFSHPVHPPVTHVKQPEEPEVKEEKASDESGSDSES